jgi:very-short-patch-repair endonuclease
MTPAERKLWVLLRDGRLDGHKFRRQQVLGGFIVDFYCHEAGLAIEVDGEVHLAQKEYDTERDRALAALGVRVRRLANDQVLTDTNTARALVRSWIDEHIVGGAPPSEAHYVSVDSIQPLS